MFYFFIFTLNCAPRTIGRTRCALKKKKKVPAESALKHVNHVLRNSAASTRIGPVSMDNSSV